MKQFFLFFVFVFTSLSAFSQYHEIKWMSRNVEYTAFAYSDEDEEMQVRVCFESDGQHRIAKYHSKIERKIDQNEWIGVDGEYVLNGGERNYSPDDFVFKFDNKQIKDPLIIDKKDRERDNYEEFFRKSISWKEFSAEILTASYLKRFFLEDEILYSKLLGQNSLDKENISALSNVSFKSLLENYSKFKDCFVPDEEPSNFTFYQSQTEARVKWMSLIETTEYAIEYFGNHYIRPVSEIQEILYLGYQQKVKSSSLKELIAVRELIHDFKFTYLLDEKDFIDEQIVLKLGEYIPKSSQADLVYYLNHLNFLDEENYSFVKTIYQNNRTNDLTQVKVILKQLEQKDKQESEEFLEQLVSIAKPIFLEKIKLYIDEVEEASGGKAIALTADFLSLADNYYWLDWSNHFSPSIFEDMLNDYNNYQINEKQSYLLKLNEKFSNYSVSVPSISFPQEDFYNDIENDVKNSFKAPSLPSLTAIVKGMWENKGEVGSVVALEGALDKSIITAASILKVTQIGLPVIFIREILVGAKDLREVCSSSEQEIFDKALISYYIEINSAYCLFSSYVDKSNSEFYSALFQEYEKAYDNNYVLVLN
jgi:hypothetical protein